MHHQQQAPAQVGYYFTKVGLGMRTNGRNDGSTPSKIGNKMAKWQVNTMADKTSDTIVHLPIHDIYK